MKTSTNMLKLLGFVVEISPVVNKERKEKARTQTRCAS